MSSGCRAERAHLCGRGGVCCRHHHPPKLLSGYLEPAGQQKARCPAPFVLGLPLEKQLAAPLLPAFIHLNPVWLCGLTSFIYSFCSHSVCHVPLELRVRVELTHLKWCVSVFCTQMPTGWKTHVRLPLGAVCPVESFL